ncbi:MAG: beta-galactosidase [Bacteroidaceae bacterium]|nr:beta-galactosidase [Bacteroidaceae bacterium]
MKKFISLFSLMLLCSASVFAVWQPAGEKIRTPWADEIDPQNVLPEYPRPLLQRADWQNLNGLWQYAITARGAKHPAAFDGEILVPFAVESSLSGVGRTLDAKSELWYERTFNVPSKWKDSRLLLHFGAVDWKADVWVDGAAVGSHTGGYTPFSFDISEALVGKGPHTLTVRVWDPCDASYQPRGKQVSKPNGIWYTSVSGIWQTVWLEPVAKHHIENLRITPDIDLGTLTVEPILSDDAAKDLVEVVVKDGSATVASGRSINGQPIVIDMPDNLKLWSPDTPFLYDVKVVLKAGGKEVDRVDSYAAMRKFSVARAEDHMVRLMLNNKPLFHMGPLDQGWWPDGLYTAPTDEALLYDVKQLKAMGFNMIRKHVKVEPARWYTHCDREGIIVWQDMPSGDRSPQWQNHRYFDGSEFVRSAESEANYRKEWKEIIDMLYSNPCVGVWVPFNEAWGQFKTPEIVAWTKQYDPTRLVNPASGGNHYPCGDILDMHNYPNPAIHLLDPTRANVLGEYGGIGLALEGHLWEPDRNWGYVQFKTTDEVTDEYVKYAKMLLELVPQGYSAGVYTQTTDCEVEVNGLMTYDRKVTKIDIKRIAEVNRALCRSLSK